jgi:hypothetical protein
MSGTDNEMVNVLFDIMFSDIGLKFPNLMLSRIFSNVGAYLCVEEDTLPELEKNLKIQIKFGNYNFILRTESMYT